MTIPCVLQTHRPEDSILQQIRHCPCIQIEKQVTVSDVISATLLIKVATGTGRRGGRLGFRSARL